MELTEQNILELALLHEWRQLAQDMSDLRKQRGLIGILVAEDELALSFQAKARRVWEIKGILFGSNILEA